ncbi:MAG: threonylcarbamoyl-AMP synthase [Thaumarchaeota archaeon]|nr:MAG: threonylcarbamoyl-AMP synthase [Nitrososphaerota archaeon]
MIVQCNEDGIKVALAIIKKGGVVVIPTDTVYGIGCDPYNHEAVKTVYKIKGREKTKQLPVLGYSKKDIAKIAFFDKLSEKIANEFWPGPVTLILQVKEEQIRNSLNLESKIAVRVPNHPCALSVLKECKLLVGTSANLSGLPPFNDSKLIRDKFSGYDVLLDAGKISDPGESTVVEVAGNQLKIIREGKVKEKELATVV